MSATAKVTYATAKNLYIKINNENIEFMQFYMNNVFWYGYTQERKRMSDVAIRCHHHNEQFNDNPKDFISYFISILHLPLTNENNSEYSFADHQKKSEDILKFVSNGICQICALYLARELQTFLRISLNFIPDLNATHVIGNTLTAILQYPSVAMYYFRNECDLWKPILCYFVRLTNMYHLCVEHWGKDDIATEYTRTAVFILSNQILRSSYLLNQFCHWNMNLIGFIEWIVKEFEFQINRNQSEEFQMNPLLNVYFTILSYFYTAEKKHLKWNELALTIFRNKLLELVNHKIKIDKCSLSLYPFNMVIKFMCKHLLNVTDVKYWKKLEMKKYCNKLKFMKRKVWKEKRRNMKCVWYKCYVQAKDLEKNCLYKCNRCKMARYCSKKCQKKDWNIGCHKDLCDKYSK